MVKMEAYHDGGMWCARGIGVDVFTQGETFDELIANIKEAVALHFEAPGARRKRSERLRRSTISR